MLNRVKLASTTVILMLLNVPPHGDAQTLEAALDSYLSQISSEAKQPAPANISEWSARHPGETVETPGAGGKNTESEGARDAQVRKWEGRWCLRSTANIDFARGVHVRRIALFYQPLVEQIYNKPLPPLPAETEGALRQHGCRLVKILSEFEGNTSPQDLAETIARRLPGERSEEPGKFIDRSSWSDFWKPVYSFANLTRASRGFYFLFTHGFADHPAVLLEWEAGTLDYGEPSSKDIDPEAGQPWLALRAAMLARLPEAPTLEMLSFLAPQAGDRFEQPRFFCDRQLVPVLRNWFTLAARSSPEQHAAALLVADAVADRLSDCEEFYRFRMTTFPRKSKRRWKGVTTI